MKEDLLDFTLPSYKVRFIGKPLNRQVEPALDFAEIIPTDSINSFVSVGSWTIS